MLTGNTLPQDSEYCSDGNVLQNLIGIDGYKSKHENFLRATVAIYFMDILFRIFCFQTDCGCRYSLLPG
jgi:hypothetical protein